MLAAGTETLRITGRQAARVRVLESSPAVAQERLQEFKAASLADPRPGLVVEYGRLVLANEAARRLLASAGSEPFLESLKAALAGGNPTPGLCLQLGTRRFGLELQPARSRAGCTTRICFLVRRPGVAPALASLTKRELGVLTWLVRGHPNGAIAARLGISVETVRKHVANALKKTGAETRAGLVGLAFGR